MAAELDPEIPDWCRQVAADIFRVSIRVKPNAKTSKVLGVDPARQCLDVSLNAPPRDGEANDELLRLLRLTLGLKRNEVLLFSGQKSRDKIIECHCTWDVLQKLFNE
jgi:uncharacterized protein (TIGR00251 family)